MIDNDIITWFIDNKYTIFLLILIGTIISRFEIDIFLRLDTFFL